MARKIVEKISDELLQKDLEKYRQRALDLGAADAKIINTDMIVIDERVRAKCTYPKCLQYGTSANCPPHAMDLDQVRRVVSNFEHVLFVRIKVPTEHMAGPEARKKDISKESRRKLHEIVAKIEAEAFYDGYHFALAFAGGSCKLIFCPDMECSALTTGQGCRHPFRARSSMEAVGMDAFTMATRVGWDVYPIGRSSLPSDIPHGTRLGLILIH